MKKNNRVLTRLTLFLLVTLLPVGSLHINPKNGQNPLSVQLFATAKSVSVSSAEETDQDAALQTQYDAAQALFDAQEYEKAAEAFEALGKFSNSRARTAESKKKANAASYQKAMAFYKAEQYYEAKEIFEALGKYEKSRSYFTNCIVRIRRIEYQQAKEMHKAGDYENAQKLFESFGKYLDSPERAKAAADIIRAQEQAVVEAAAYKKALILKEAGDLEGARDAFIEAGDCKDATDQIYTIVDVLAWQDTYKKADRYFAAGSYEDAYDWFTALDDYEDSAERAKLSKDAWLDDLYTQAAALQNNAPSRACIMFLSLGDYQESANLAHSLQATVTEQDLYAAADAFMQEGDFLKAKLGFEAIPAYKDSAKRTLEMSESVQQLSDFKQALFLRSIRKEKEANALFKALGKFNWASIKIQPIVKFSAKQLRDDQTSPKSSVFTAPDGTKHRYQIFKGVRTWIEAKLFCEVLGGHLATLTTPEENDFVNNFMQDSGYITAYFGLSDEARKGNWEWVTGEPFEYKNWSRFEPNRGIHRGALERYGMFLHKHTDGTWNDSHFYEDSKADPGCSFICEWDE